MKIFKYINFSDSYPKMISTLMLQNLVKIDTVVLQKKMRATSDANQPQYLGDLLERTLKNIQLFSKCVNISHINTLCKKSKIKFSIGRLLYCLKNSETIINFENQLIPSNILSTILLILCSFVKVLKRYCQDTSGLYHSNLNNFCIDSVSVFLTHLPLLDICQDKSVVFIILSGKTFRGSAWFFLKYGTGIYIYSCLSFCHSVFLSF